MNMQDTQPAGGRKRGERRSVALAVRMKIDARWGDATVLNASDRGLMIKTAKPPEYGSYVEVRPNADVGVRRGAEVGIIARVIWRRGNQVGLRTQDRVNVQALMRRPINGRSHDRPTPEPVVATGDAARHAIGGLSSDSRHKGAMMQYCAIGGIVTVAACIAGAYVYGILSSVTQAISSSM